MANQRKDEKVTVRELIDKLRLFDPNLPVYKMQWDGGDGDCTGFDTHKAYVDVCFAEAGHHYPDGEMPRRVVIE